MALTKEQIKEFEKELSEAEDYWALSSVANNLIDVDKKWAKEVFKKAEAKASDSSELRSHACGLLENLKDKEWAKKVFKKAEKMAESCDDFSYLANVLSQEMGDKEWAKKVYKKAEVKAEGYELTPLADAIYETLSDKEWAKKVYKKAEKKAESSDDLLNLASQLFHVLNEKEWVRQVLKKTEEKANELYQFNGLVNSICEYLDDNQWAKKVCEKALKIAQEKGDNDQEKEFNKTLKKLSKIKNQKSDFEPISIKTKSIKGLPVSFFCCMNPDEPGRKEFRVALLSLKAPMVKSDGYVRYTIAFGYSGGGMQADIQSKYIVFPKSKNYYLFIGAGDEWNNVYMKNKKNKWEKIYESSSSDPVPSCTNEDEDGRIYEKLGKKLKSYLKLDDEGEFLILTDNFNKGLVKKKLKDQIQYFTKDFEFECLYEISDRWSLLTSWTK